MRWWPFRRRGLLMSKAWRREQGRLSSRIEFHGVTIAFPIKREAGR